MAKLFERILRVVFLCSVIIACEKEEFIIDEPFKEVVVNYVPIELELINLVNVHRAELGFPILVISGLVSTEATSHSVYMVEQATVSHDNFDIRMLNLIQQASAQSVGENVAFGYRNAEGFMNAWLNNSGHRSIIEGEFTHFGISARKNADGRYYITHMFIER